MCLASDTQQGMTFQYSGGTRNLSDQYQWVQLVNDTSVIDQTPAAGSACKIKISGLDGGGPMSPCFGTTACDSPGLSLVHPPFIEVARYDSFSTFLMYTPQGGIAVPIYRVDWTWSADAVYASRWQFRNGQLSANTGGGWVVVQLWNADSSYPQWLQIADPNSPCVPQ